MASKGDIDPAYRIPLGSIDLQMLGRFSAIWAQIDVNLTVTICGLLQIAVGAGQTLMENMTTGPRLNLFRRLYKERLSSDEFSDRSKRFCSAMGPLIESRNHLLHGMWGMRVFGEGNQSMEVGCHYFKTKANIAPQQLATLTKEAADQSFEILMIMKHVYGQNTNMSRHIRREFFYGGGEPPEWMKEPLEIFAPGQNPPPDK